MAISMYQASAPRFVNTLNNLSGILDKVQAHAEAKKIDPLVLTASRLYPDMFALARQVQIACDTAKGAVARLAGVEVPKHEDTEQTAAVREAFKGTGTAIGAFIDLAEQAGAEAVYPIAGNAAPSAPVDTAAYEFMAGRIVDAVAKGCDAVLLDLHGAMVTRAHDDGEGELLGRLRRIAPDIPIGVALDMHTNLFPAMGRLATVIAGYQTYPHVDMYETGLRAGKAILSNAKPVLAFGHRPMLPHVMRQSSLDSPNKEIQARAREMERQGALAASFFVGFPHADIPYAGSSAVVVTDGDAAKAQALCDELLD